MTAAAGILVVDDDDDFRDACVEVLSSAGFVARGESSARCVLDSLRAAREHPALILLDLMMPHTDGWHFLDEQRCDPLISGIPVVVMSASGTRAPHGILPNRFLSKLASPDELVAIVARVFAERS